MKPMITKHVENLKHNCINVIMNKKFDRDTLYREISEKYKGNRLIDRDIVIKYIDYLIDDAKDDADYMWGINSIVHFIEVDL